MRIFYFFRSPLSFKYGTLFVRHDVPYMRPRGNGTPNFSRLFPTRSLDGGGGWCYYTYMKKISQAVMELIEDAYRSGVASGVMACVPDELMDPEEVDAWIQDNSNDRMIEDLWMEDRDWLEARVEDEL